MKRRIHTLAAVLLLTGLFVTLISPLKALAAGVAPYYLSLSTSSSSANAGGSKITVTAHAYALKCANLSVILEGESCTDGSTPSKSGRINYQLFITANDATLDGVQTEGGKYYVRTGEDGKAQFTVSSAAAGTRQVTVSTSVPSSENGPQSVSLTFKAVAPAPAPKPKTPAPAPAPAPTPEPPKTPEVASMQVAGQDVADKNNITLESNKPFALAGKTVANGVVKLYIFSTPREATVTADANGNWTYTIEGLEPGSHHVEAEVTDPATQKTSARGTVLAFTVQEPQKTTETPLVSKKASNPWKLWAIGGVIVLAGAGGAWWWLKKRKHNSATLTGTTAASPDSVSRTAMTTTTPPSEPSQQDTNDSSDDQGSRPA